MKVFISSGLAVLGLALIFIFLWSSNSSQETAQTPVNLPWKDEHPSASTSPVVLDSESARSQVSTAFSASGADGSERTAHESVRITVKFADEKKNPLGNVRFFAVLPEIGNTYDSMDFHRTLQGHKPKRLPCWTTTTGKNGEAVLAVPATTSEYWFVGWKEHHAYFMTARSLPEQSPELDLGQHSLADGGGIKFLVRGPSGHPAQGAVVQAWLDFGLPRMDMAPWLLETDELGQVQLLCLPTTSMRVGAVSKPFLTSELMSVSVAPGETRVREIRLHEGGSIRGRVLTADGHPATHARISWHTVTDERKTGFVYEDPWNQLPHPQPNESGEFEIHGLSPTMKYQVTARSAPGVETVSGVLRVSAEVLLRLPPESMITGFLFTPDGKPATGAELHLIPYGASDWKPSSISKLEIEADGAFRKVALSGRYWLAASHASGELFLSDPLSVEDSRDMGNLYLQSGGRLRLQVVSETDKMPVPTAIVRAEDPPLTMEALLEMVHQEKADEQQKRRHWQAEFRETILTSIREEVRMIKPGEFYWSQLPAGKHHFKITADGYAAKFAEIQLFSGQEECRIVELQSASKLLVKVSDSQGRPLSGRLFTLTPHEEAVLLLRDAADVQSTNQRGEVQFTNLRPATYGLYAGAYLWATSGAEPLQVLTLSAGDNATEVILEENVDLSVVVLDANGPVPDATVSATHKDGGQFDFFFRSLYSNQPRTDAQGRIVLSNLRIGENELSISRPHGYAHQQSYEIQGPGQEVTVYLKGFSLQGQLVPKLSRAQVRIVRGPPQRPVQERPVQERSAEAVEDAKDEEGRFAPIDEFLHSWKSSSQVVETSVQADENGVFRCMDLPPGLYTLHAEADGYYQSAAVQADLRQTSAAGLIVPMEAGGRLSLRVSGLPGKFFGELYAQYAGAEGKLEGRQYLIEENGLTEFKAMPPGAYKVQIRRHASASIQVLAELPVDLRAGQQTRLNWEAPLDFR